MSGTWGASEDPDGTWLDYDVVDVFTDRPYAGNPLAVVHGTDGLGAGQLGALAREFNLSETAFPTVRAARTSGGEAASDYDLRIFTPQHELPFAGHPSIGAVWALAQRGLLPGEPGLRERRPRVRRQRCGAGVVDVELGATPADLVWLTGGTTGTPRVVDPTEPLAVLRLTTDDLVAPPQPGTAALVAGTGLDFCFLLVRAEALHRAELDVAALRRLRAAWPGVEGLVLAAVQPASPDVGVTVRAFGDDVPGGEDPATGSAALGLGVVLVRSGLVAPDGVTAVRVAQGAVVGRPSTLHVRVQAAGGVAVRAQVGGGVRLVARGRIRRPSAD